MSRFVIVGLSLWVALGAAEQPAIVSVDGPWAFATRRRSERLHASADQMPDASESVTLPHRVPAPNTALWYAADIQLPRHSALEVDSDDGAQVFVGGRLLHCHRSRFFVPPEMAGRRRVVVRVLNNAVQGGLRRVSLVDAGQVPWPLPSRDLRHSGRSGRIGRLQAAHATSRTALCVHRLGGQSQLHGPGDVPPADRAHVATVRLVHRGSGRSRLGRFRPCSLARAARGLDAPEHAHAALSQKWIERG